MGFSRDELPWVGELPNKPNLYMAAGFTGHGMPNTWLCGKAVAGMVQNKSVRDVVKDIGLPKAYLITGRRIQKAMGLEDVEVRDRAEMETGRRQREGDRPHSGYA